MKYLTPSKIASLGAAEILGAVGQILADPNHWTTGARARRTDGACTIPTSKGAYCFCLIGALDLATWRLHQAERNSFSDYALLHLGNATHNRGQDSIPIYNDALGRRHAEILEVIAEARAAAEADATVAAAL